MGKRVTVPVRVHPDTRKKWKSYVESNSEWSSVSDLIRGSVQRQIDGWYNRQTTPEIDSEALEEIEQKLDEQNKKLNKILNDGIDVEIDAEEALLDLKAEIFMMTPKFNNLDEIMEAGPRDNNTPLENYQETGIVDYLHQHYKLTTNYPRDLVQSAIDDMLQMKSVTKERVNQKVRIYKNE